MYHCIILHRPISVAVISCGPRTQFVRVSFAFFSSSQVKVAEKKHDILPGDSFAAITSGLIHHKTYNDKKIPNQIALPTVL